MGFCSTHQRTHLSTYLFTYLNYVSKPMKFLENIKNFNFLKNGCKSDHFFPYPLLTLI
jgi:hypothetical protein